MNRRERRNDAKIEAQRVPRHGLSPPMISLRMFRQYFLPASMKNSAFLNISVEWSSSIRS